MFTDPILANLSEICQKPPFTDRSVFLFEDLIGSIISQQLSVKAADTIFARFKILFTPKPFASPEDILKIPDQTIRDAGISFPKITYIKAVAKAFATKQIDAKKINSMTNEEVITELTKIHGVGKWTAEMILIFTLNRPDVFSLGDLGVRNAIRNLYHITDQQEILKLSEQWKPYRSIACWYLWKSLEKK